MDEMNQKFKVIGKRAFAVEAETTKANSTSGRGLIAAKRDVYITEFFQLAGGPATLQGEHWKLVS